ncbi:UNVERIFIED_CONTAM: hypothetical protein GTU68_064288 [Idotea baltica]|nr:hypothetical protein [Idotea baltica]
MFKLIHKLLILLSFSVFIVGCSSNADKELPPAELPDINQTVSLDEQWDRSIGDGQGEILNFLTPAIDGKRIFATDDKGLVISMDRFNGDVIWKKELDVPASGGITASYGMILLGTLKGEVIALDATTGEEKWHVKVGGEVLSPPANNGSVIVVQTTNDYLIALDAATGSQLWAFTNSPAILTLRGTSAPLATDKLAIAALSSGKVVALDVNRGIPVWEQAVAIPEGRSELDRVVDIDGGLLLSDNKLYVVSYQGNLAELDLNSGEILWKAKASSAVGVAQKAGSVYFSSDNGTLESVDSGSTSTVWRNNSLARRQLSAPALISNYLLVGDFEGYLHVANQSDGKLVGREKIDSDGLRTRALIEGDWIYAFGNGGELEALKIEKQ